MTSPIKKCAGCKVDVQPSNWVRTASGFLLCGKCWHEVGLEEQERLKALYPERTGRDLCRNVYTLPLLPGASPRLPGASKQTP